MLALIAVLVGVAMAGIILTRTTNIKVVLVLSQYYYLFNLYYNPLHFLSCPLKIGCQCEGANVQNVNYDFGNVIAKQHAQVS